MCRVVRGASCLVRHVRQSPHLGAKAAEAAEPLWPPEAPRTHSQANAAATPACQNATKQESCTTDGEEEEGATASDQILRGSVCVCGFLSYGNQSLKGTAVSQSEVWWELRWGIKDRGSKAGDGRGWMDNQVLTAPIFFSCLLPFAEFIPLAVCGENVVRATLLGSQQ